MHIEVTRVGERSHLTSNVIKTHHHDGRTCVRHRGPIVNQASPVSRGIPPLAAEAVGAERLVRTDGGRQYTVRLHQEPVGVRRAHR